MDKSWSSQRGTSARRLPWRNFSPLSMIKLPTASSRARPAQTVSPTHLSRLSTRLWAFLRGPPRADNAMAQRVQVAEAYRQAFDPKNETDDWEHHRRIREKGAAKAERDLKGDESIACQDIQYGPPGSGKVVLKASRRRPGETGPRPCIFFVHGGLMTGSNRYVGVNSMLLDWGRDLLGDAVVLSVEYGRPPQSKGLEPSDNCWETLCWAWENREDLGIDPKRLVIYGASAGGCLATSMTLRWMATHEKNEALSKNPSLREFREMADPPFPQLKGVYLEAPMLDDRCRTRSHQQYARGDENVGGNLSSTQLAHR